MIVARHPKTEMEGFIISIKLYLEIIQLYQENINKEIFSDKQMAKDE